jgi:aromatase
MAGHTDNRVVINAPDELVWSMTNDVESWPTLFTEYASVEVLHREADTVRFRLTTRPDHDGRSWSWVSERTADPTSRTVRARRIETGPLLESMQILWEYRPVEGGVELRWLQEFQLTPTAPVTEAQAVEHLNRQTAIELAHIKQQVERAATGRAS